MEENIKTLIVAVCLLFLTLLNLDNAYRITELENKINGNCIYVNNEYYCKDWE